LDGLDFLAKLEFRTGTSFLFAGADFGAGALAATFGTVLTGGFAGAFAEGF
jgi:hypothetical protein